MSDKTETVGYRLYSFNHQGKAVWNLWIVGGSEEPHYTGTFPSKERALVRFCEIVGLYKVVMNEEARRKEKPHRLDLAYGAEPELYAEDL